MSKFEKMKAKILSTPSANDITAKEIQSFLQKYGFQLKHVNGSHFVYAFPSKQKELVINIPMHSPIKPWYIDAIRECIEQIEG